RRSGDYSWLVVEIKGVSKLSSRVEYSRRPRGSTPNEDILMRDPKDTELLERLKNGDEGALTDLADTYSSMIYQLAFRYLRNKEDAEEITQDVLFKAYRTWGAFRGPSR